MTSVNDPQSAWYRTPLDGDDVLAGVSLVAMMTLFIPLYCVVIVVFVRTEKVRNLEELTVTKGKGKQENKSFSMKQAYCNVFSVVAYERNHFFGNFHQTSIYCFRSTVG